jgi:hypothetical protein
MLVKLETSRLISQRAVLRKLVVAAGTERQRGAAFSSGNGSLGKSLPAVFKGYYQYSRSLSSVPFRAILRTAATPTA